MNIRTLSPASTFRDMPLLIKHVLAYSLVLGPEREIVYRDLVRYNYYTFNQRVRQLAGLLRDLGVAGGETVAFMDYDSHRFLEAYFAVPMTGNVLHQVNWRLSPAQILYTLQHAEDVVLFVNKDFLPLIDSFVEKIPTLRHVILLTDESPTGALPVGVTKILGDYETLLAAEPEQYDFPDFSEDAVATTFYTTGTTGDPKGVYYTHRQLVLHTLALAANFGFVGGAACRLSSDDVYLPLTPMFHVHAWGFPYLATMYSLKQVYAGKATPPMIAYLYANEKPTLSHCVPTILQMVLQCPEAANMDLSGWKMVIGGSALPKSLARAALQRGIDVISGYGMSETCPVVATTYIKREDARKDLDWQVEERVRSGKIVAFVECSVVGEDGTPAPLDDHSPGEIVLRAPWLTQGYVKDPERGDALWKGGHLHTGDVATMNGAYSLRIADRTKDIIKSGGEWISSIELENLIGLHEGVAEVAVVGAPDPKWGERPYALVVPKPGATLTREIIQEHVRQFIREGRINKWALPENIRFVDTIPKTSVGKLDKKKIRSMI